MQNYEVGISGAGNIPDNPQGKVQDKTQAEQEKTRVQQQLTDEVLGKAKEVAKEVIDTGIGAVMGFQKSIPNAEPEMSDVDLVIMNNLEIEMEEKKAALDAEISAHNKDVDEMAKLKEESDKYQKQIQDKVKQEFAPDFVDAEGDAFDDGVDSDFGLKEPAFYYNQFIEENGGEPLTHSQIKDKMKAIEAELNSDNVMTDIEYQELQMQRNVLIDMLHGETY